MRLEYFQMVDRITELDVPGRRIGTCCVVPEQSPVFEGHFPGYPILPGVLMIETMAQTAGWLVMALHGFRRMCFLAAVKEAKMGARNTQMFRMSTGMASLWSTMYRKPLVD